tara:strand:+ start:1150 stop:1479 length:330 start_codon:yes stop_codon:yes gene_type:complete
MITNTWGIIGMDCAPTMRALTDYVVALRWTLNATDGTYRGSAYGTASFDVSLTSPKYIPYADITLEQAIVWAKNSLGVEQVAMYEKAVADQIEAQSIPPTINPPLPWNI